MGTTRIKVIDLSSDEKEIKTSRKHAEKLAGIARLETAKTDKKPATDTQETEIIKTQHSVPSDTASEPSQITKPVEPSPTSDEPVQSTPKAATTATRTRHHHIGKKYQAAKKLVEDKTYAAKDALQLLPKTSITHFDPSVEVHLNVTDKNIKASINFPHPTGAKTKLKRYLVFSEKTVASKVANIIPANEKTIADIQEGKLKPGRDFDAVITTAKFMPDLAKIAKILGPRGMMPNPKNGTVTSDIEKFFAQGQSSTSVLKTDPTAPIIHVKIGKLSQKQDELRENLKALILGIGPSKITKAVIASTMGPAIKLDTSSIGL